MEFYNNHSKIIKTSSSDGDKDVSTIYSNKFLKESSVIEANDSLKDQSFKISIDRNNNKHVLSPLGHSQGPRGIKVSRLSLQCSESSIRHSIIQQFGVQNKTNQNRSYNIKSIVLESAAGPSPTRWAIVTFISPYDAEKALQMSSKSQSVELHPGYDLFDFDELNITTNCPQGLDEFHPKASRTLQISNLPAHLNNFKTLYEYFSKLGKVLDIEIKPKLVLHASALVQFSDISKVVKILVSPRAVLKCLVGSSITSSTSFQFGPSFPTNCIWLGQISTSINENQITEYFSRFGHVLEVVQDIKQQKALVYLDNAFAAQQSIIHLKRKNSFLGTCRVQVDYASLECQATISYWLSNNFPALPVPPDSILLKQSQSDNSLTSTSVIYNRSISRINSNQDKLVLNINKSITSEQNSQLHSSCVQKSSELQASLNILSNLEPVNYNQPTISIKNYPQSIGTSGLNISEMVITERIPTDNATRVTPICSKRTNNIRVTNPYDSSYDTASNNRFSQNYDPSININSTHVSQTPIEYQNQNLTTLKKDRNYSENNNEGKIVNNIRLSCSPVTWSTNTCTSQSSDISKSDLYSRQFSPWSVPVRNRVVARVDPFSHTSSNTHNSSQANSNILSKTVQSSPYLNRIPNTITSHNVNRNIQKTLSSYLEKQLNTSVKQDNFMSLSKNILHSNERDFGNLKRRTNYNQPLTYRIAKNSDVPKSFDNRTPIFTGVHKLKSSKSLNYKVSDVSDISNKQVTAAEVFGEDFSDLSDSDSASSFILTSRKRKQKLSKCKSPSVDSSSTISVLSSEKQNHFIRVSKVRYHTNKKSIHLKPKRSKNRLKSNKCSSDNASSDEPCSELHKSNINRQKMKLTLKDKTEAMSSSMKPLTVNVSLSNFEDNLVESDEISSVATDNSSLEIPKKCVSIGKQQKQIPNNKRKIGTDKSSVYRNDDLNASSSSENDHKDFKRKYKVNSNRKSKSFLNEYEERKRPNSYVVDRRYKENKFVSKISENKAHKVKLESEHSKSKMTYSSAHNFLSNKCLNEKDNEKNSYLSRNQHSSESPPIKRKKVRHEEISKTNIYRSSDLKLSDSSFNMDLHSAFKRHEYQQLSQEISSDAVFQKEFDEFKRDQASDQSSVHRKGNSSKVSSASSVGIKTFSSYEKYKSQKPTKSSKVNSVYTTSPDCKNIFQIDMNNINMYESMYDKVKRRAQKQAETKVNRNSPEINDSRNKRKSKMSDHKHKSSKENKVYYKRHKKSRDVIVSPTSTVYSDDSSALVDDSQSNYSSMYVASDKGSVHRNKNIHNRKMYKSTKNSTVSSFESPNSFSKTNWKRSKNKNEMLRIFKHSSTKMPSIKYFSSKRVDHDFENENEEHENISEFSFQTNTSNVNFTNKSNKEYLKSELEEVANISDATASTEPMEYAEVDLESLKMSDDDWKSGLSSQSSSESGNNISKNEINNTEIIDKTVQIVNEKQSICDKVQIPSFTIEDNSEIKIKMESDDKTADKMEPIDNLPTNIETEPNKTVERQDAERILIEVDNHECVKEEQDIAIASIMLKEENESKSPIDWKSNIPTENNNVLDTNSSISHIFDNSCNSENIELCSRNVEDTNLIANKPLENNSDASCSGFSKSIVPELLPPIIENVLDVSELNNVVATDSENSVLGLEKSNTHLLNNPITPVVAVETSNTSNITPQIPINSAGSDKVIEMKATSDHPVTSNNETIPTETALTVSVSTGNCRTTNKAQSQSKINSSPNEKIDLTSYVKGVIEQVKREQNAENQNKLKLEKNSKRMKKFNNNANTSSKTSQSSTNSTSSNIPVSFLTTLQKSPAVTLQASVIEHSDSQISVSSHSQPNIPGVNVCSPVNSTHSAVAKPVLDASSVSLPEMSIHKSLTTRSNVISNLSSGSTQKPDQNNSNSSVSELKINTELNTPQTSNEVNSSVAESLSTQLSSSSLKSPSSEDHTKQRIFTRLRREDPSRSDGNYKIVTTTWMTRSGTSANNCNNQSKPNSTENNNQIFTSNKSFNKQPDVSTGSVSETASLVSDKISDPYEPNFDESPLEFSRFRKNKNIFFPYDNKISKSSHLVEDTRSVTPNLSTTKSISANTVISTSTTGSTTYSGIDSVSQIIEDVVHGNFNYNEYITSFKNGKLPSLQISPPTTPLTFVSNDSRDCSSVSADNMSYTNIETTSASFRKHHSSSKSSNHANVSLEDNKKTDSIPVINSSYSSNTKQGVAIVAAISNNDINSCTSYSSTDKTSPPIKEMITLNSISKLSNQNVSVPPVFHPSQSRLNTDILALINLYQNKEVNCQKTSTNISHESTQPQTIPISSIQLQSYNRDVSTMLPNTCTSPFEKDTICNSKLALNFEQNLPLAVSKNNLLNITVNSSQPQQSIIQSISSAVHNQDDNNTLKAYLSLLQRSNLTGLNVDPSTLSKFQSAVNESSLKNINVQTESNTYRNVQNIAQLDPLTIPPIQETNEECVNSNVTTHSPNISARSIADLIIPRVYPLVWEGKLSLKNEEAKVALHFVHGNTDLLNACMHFLMYSGSLQWNNTGSLKIVQRMRLDMSQLEGVQRRMQNASEYCIGLALPGGDDINQWMKQSQILKEGFIKYMREKGAAGIINVCHPENNQQGLYVVHIFPPCDFSTNQLLSTAPDLHNVIEINKFPNLLVVITTV